VHIVYSSTFAAHHSATGLAAIQVMAVGLLAAPPALFATHRPMTMTVSTVIIFTAVFTTALTFVCMMWAQARVTATEAAVILSFEPVAAMLTSMIVGEETITGPFLLGASMIVAAMIVSQLPAPGRKRLDQRGGA
jgi:drug/metabolite transporter (DMT)-like permease